MHGLRNLSASTPLVTHTAAGLPVRWLREGWISVRSRRAEHLRLVYFLRAQGSTLLPTTGPHHNRLAELDGIPDVENVLINSPAQSRGNQYNARRLGGDAERPYRRTSRFTSPSLTTWAPARRAGCASAGRPAVRASQLGGHADLRAYFLAALVNEFRVNGTRFADNAINDSRNTVNYGVPYDNVQNYPFGLQYGGQHRPYRHRPPVENTYEVRDTVSHTFGAHAYSTESRRGSSRITTTCSATIVRTFAFNGLWAFANDASVFEQQYANTATGALPTQRSYSLAGIMPPLSSTTEGDAYANRERWSLSLGTIYAAL